MNTINYPDNKRFAFSVFDDTDVATLDSIRPLYDYMYGLGLVTTKSVWCLDYDGKSHFRGSHTLQNKVYTEYLQDLHKRGFEIGFHGATMESATRSEIEQAIAIYTSVFGTAPEIYAAHSVNRDNLYWGAQRFSSTIMKLLYIVLSGESAKYFQGHDPTTQYFWGDIAQKHIKFMRSFTFSEFNLLNLKLPLLYRRNDTPWIDNWFLTCDADNVEEFNNLLKRENQIKLETQGGICIVSTHFGKGYVDGGKVHPKTKQLLKELSQRGGWFAPVSEILRFYSKQHPTPTLNKKENFNLEARWFISSIKRRIKRKTYKATEVQYLNSIQ